MVRQFLFEQLNPNDHCDMSEIPLSACPHYDDRIYVFNSAWSRFYASDLSGIGGMQMEFIRSTPLWRKEGPRKDCVFVTTNPEATGMWALDIAHVLSFFSFRYQSELYECTVIWWFDKIGDAPDEDTGMWMVRPSYLPNHTPNCAIIHINTIHCGAHLIPIYMVPMPSPTISSLTIPMMRFEHSMSTNM